MKYHIERAAKAVDLSAAWDSPCWKFVEALQVACVRPESSDHHPGVELKLQYDEKGLYGLFLVKDRYVRATHTKYQEMVCQDSCVEFFLKLPDAGYFNFEMNCSGNILTYYVRDWTPAGGAYKDYDVLPDEDMDTIQRFHTMPDVVEPEITEPTEWRLGFFIPFALIQKYGKCALPQPGTVWHMNAYKCGDQTSHPHWLAWSPVKELNFHRPQDFGELEF